MSRLALYLLGPPRLELDGEPVHLPRRKALALLAYLAVTGRSHSRDSLAALFWPRFDQRSARAELRRILSVINGALGKGWLTVDRETAALNPDADVWLDVHRFRDLRAAADTGEHPPAEGCLSLLEQALELYGEGFVAGFALRDSAPFEHWSLQMREQLERQGLAALERLAAQCEERGEIRRALACTRRLVERAPWQEKAHRSLMRLLALNGERSAALAQYETCCRTLKEELDVEPAEETTQLYRRIRDGYPDPSAYGSPTPPRRPSNLPAQLTPFVGREYLLAQIGDRLRDPACRLLTLVGPGGSGKTRLALEAAAREIDCYPHGVFFVPLAPLRAVESIVPTVAQALGFTFFSQGEPKAQLLDYLRGKCPLLVLDNFEHLVEGAGLATDILQAAPEVKALVSSRVGLHVQGEHRFPVEGMAYPDQTSEVWQTSDVLGHYGALKLFLESARRAQPGFALTADNLADVARICGLVEGMPLGILLAAVWVALFTPAEIGADLERGLDFLETDLRDAPERQRSLRAAFDHSWNLLNKPERETFAALSVFHGSFTRQAAQQVAGASPRELMALVDKSLLHRLAEGRYEVHELLRQYAAEQLAASPDGEPAARDRHSVHYAAALERWAADLKGPRQQEALAEIEDEIEDARAAWGWAVERGQVDQLDQAMEGLGLFYDWHTRYEEGETAFHAAAEAMATAKEALPATPVEKLRTWVNTLSWQGLFAFRWGHADQARECLGQGMDLLDRPPWPIGMRAGRGRTSLG